MQIIKNPKKKKWSGILQRPAMDNLSLEKKVKKILENVKKNGDKSVRKYSARFDGIKMKYFTVSEKELANASALLNEDLKSAIHQAKINIEKFHRAQLQKKEFTETMPGIRCWRKAVAIEKIGLYIPGGTAPLFSTVLMLGVPAKIAGCNEIILCSPPNKNGEVHPAILYTAGLVGINKMYKVGGVQAMGAMAYGTRQIPQVNKIFGPGNQYVTCAKQLLQKDGVAIDLPAGPSEVAIYADETAHPSFIAADLLSQAEHGVDSHVLLVLRSGELMIKCLAELEKQLELLPRKDLAKKALENSKVILVNNEEEAMDLLNEYAPEHLILNCKNAELLADKVVNAGSVFLGDFSPESAGDYASGTNHVLPTNGYAKSYSGVSVESFVKMITFQKLSEEGLKNIAKTIELMATEEGLEAHKNAISIRLKSFEGM